MALRRRSQSRAWFESKVKELAAIVRALPRPRRRALFDALDAGDELGARESLRPGTAQREK